MSPTRATTLRNVATLGQQNVKHNSPRIKRPVARSDTVVSPVEEAVTSAAPQEDQGYAISGAIITESAMSSPDVAIYTEGRDVVPWTSHRAHSGGISNLTDLAPPTFEPAVRGVAMQNGGVLRGVGTALSRAGGEMSPTISDPASAVFEGIEITEDSVRAGQCVKTERALQKKQSGQHTQPSSSNKPAATGQMTQSHAGPIVQPKLFLQGPMPHKLSAARRSTIGPLERIADNLAARAKAAGLPMPANTVAKRRESHGHLLSPITNKLENLGLLKPKSDGINPFASKSAPVSTASQHVRQMFPETPHTSPSSASVAVPQAPQERTMAVPPHLRRKNDAASEDEPTSNKNAANIVSGITDPRAESDDFEARSPQIPSLRATAQEFTPMWKPKTIEQELGLLDWEGWFSYRSSAEWNALHPGIRAAIQAIRDYKCNGGRPPSGTFPGMTPTKIRSKTANQRFWANLMQSQSPGSNSNSLISMIPSDIVEAMQETVAQHDADGGVEAGQVLNLEINPETNALQWVMQVSDGRKVSASFGRAAAPVAALDAAYAFGSPSTVTVRPASTNTSPRYCETSPARCNKASRSQSGNLNSRGWSIASALRDPSGWAIGDGREIRYVGNSNINLGTSYNTVAPWQPYFREGPEQAPRMIGSDQDDENTSLPLAPRSREQWSKLLPQSRIPCDNVEITRAIEQIPSASLDEHELYGFCASCSGETH
ncbi:hypothetical protein DOTSEDRAFT_70329 [Dothistroma septosporum NZE10]|uniref:Uncharacterized protein n=1 Tax=Dothistroma septosporum (strain NZE10 / CBS 128990) TaxID=675120 RepID=N1PTL0_DOTSN|nr:hypothetical protein DOTSEDRAFT_70329 [Dothistroma septosporum NZE10]